MADLERPKSVAFDIRDRFDDTMERLKVKTPGPGNYKRPADSCHIHNPNSLSIPFWKTVNDGSLAHRRKKQQEYHSLSPAHGLQVPAALWEAPVKRVPPAAKLPHTLCAAQLS